MGAEGWGLFQPGVSVPRIMIRVRSSPLTHDCLCRIQQSPLPTHPRCPPPPPYPPQPGILHRDLSEEEVDMVSMLQGMDKVWL